MKKIVHAVGARPNFIKIAPVVKALVAVDREMFHQVIVHTGQHYNEKLSSDILLDVQLPTPDRFLGVGSGTHGEQTGRIMIAFERVLLEESPDLVVVAGDVNSTLACALVAAKLAVPIAHVEAGLRSGDWTMPEEMNRVLTDRVADFLFTHSPEAETNLIREGIDPSRIYYVGNTMIDSLRRFEAMARVQAAWRAVDLNEGEYVLVTLHRPSNVDDAQRLGPVVDALVSLSRHAPVVFPIHPRTRARLHAFNLLERLASSRVRCIDPVGYLTFLSLEIGAGAILTDSGGIQEEASALGVPCYTFRPNTERPITVTLGTNTLIGEDPAAIARIRLTNRRSRIRPIPYWDGHASNRLAEILVRELLHTESTNASV